MLEAIAEKSFKRSDTRQHVKRNQKMTGPDSYIRELERIGSVREVCALPGPPQNKAVPHPAVGAQSSASQAAQALPQTRLSKSEDGGLVVRTVDILPPRKKKRKKRAQSSSRTRASE